MNAVHVTSAFTAGALIGIWIWKQVERKRSSKHLIRPNIQSLDPYRCARDDYDQGTLLDANENSYGPPLSSKMNEKYQEYALERYPCPYQKNLKQKIGKFRNIQVDQIFLGVGSDEAIDLLIRICCVPGIDSIMVTPPTYGMYSVCAKINDVDVLSIPLTPSFHLQTQKMLQALHANVKIVFLCSPGNPTATVLRKQDIIAILENPNYSGLVVVDEAYIDFADEPSLCALINQYDRLVVLQTLSKGFGLAGIRLGMAFANPSMIQVMNNVKAPYNVNKLTTDVAMDAFNHLETFQATISSVKKEKQRVVQLLHQVPSVQRVLASDTNFVLFQIPNAYDIYKEMATNGVVIRYRGNLIHLKDCLRATIGRPEENDQMIQLLTQTAARLNA